ncbi:uncharacterized protein FOMMEDRAFT_158821 [Fomitiporia mediterranea MF3/22]|uniref:uncharacterized protein n=1 Tax=Fomitiporia mediterranea (strain MF3/22) TaxID=694068 RepID=UPI00044091C4|nr:uncharacterized protein FOMMEDRAFT_158821 [Fomitiporia mediterranea MF3/22]EJD01669.1 hypothetical protein FOMMEDRAFT_158821 [Fomitiporia mediterranea MF3/22]
MPRSTFVGVRCLENQARNRIGSSVRSRGWQVQFTNQTRRDGLMNAYYGSTLLLLRGPKKSQFAEGFGLRVKGSDGLRVRTRSSVLKTLQIQTGPILYQPSAYLISAPVFIAPIIAFLKSSIVFKATGAVVTFVKSTFVAKIFASAVAYLKSGTVFKAITAIGRISFAIIASLRLQGRRILKWWHGPEQYERIRAEQKASGKKKHSWHFRRTTIVCIATPIACLVIATLASLERTPVWGRWRVIMMSSDEEARLVEEFLRPGSVPGAHLDTTTARDWLAILRAACGEEAGPPGTLMGMSVLDPNVDWRARWVMNTFARLEDGVRHVNLTSEDVNEGCNVVNFGSTRFAIPPVEYPLTIRPAALKHHGRSEDEHVEGPLVTRYGLLVIDSPVCNAFSLGFGPALQSESRKDEEAPGVVVVFTGLLDEILGRPENTSAPEKPAASSASSALFGVFQQAVVSSPQNPNLPAPPTKHDTEQLASVLAHELGHLLLSHSLETRASNDMYERLGIFFTDLIRTAVYPLTAIFGPAFNDWFGELIRVNSALGLRVTSSCASRAAEFEADLVGLRILLGAGIDPRIALSKWGVDGLFDRIEHRPDVSAAKPGDSEESWLERNGFARSHPMNGERHQRILEELEKWEELARKKPSDKTTAEKIVNDVAPQIPISKAARQVTGTV